MKRLFVVLLLLPFIMSAAAQETYYWLHNDMNPEHSEYKLMDYMEPKGGSSASINLDEGAAIWATPPFERDAKINGDVKITVFLEAFFIREDLLPFQVKIIKASLIDIAPSGNIDIIDSTRPTPIFFPKNNTLKSWTFKINNVERVIPAGHCLGIKIEKTFDLLSYFPFSILSPFFATYVLYDSTYTKSYVLVPFNITGEGISLECFNNRKEVKPGEEAIYTVIIYNNGEQNDTVRISSSYTGDDWKVEIEKTQVKVPARSFSYTDVTVTAPENASEDDYLNITIYAEGSTGSDSLWLNTTIAPPEYGVKVIAKDKEVKAEPGKTATFIFTVENTGDLYDTYDLFVTCVWPYTLEKNSISLDAGESTDVKVFVKVPENATNGTTRLVALTAKSVNSEKESTDDATLRVYFVTPSEGGKGEGGLRTLGYVLFVCGVIALLAIAYYMGRTVQKMALLECDERMAEVPPGKTAEFNIKVTNPLEKDEKNRMRYRFRIEGRIPEGWTVDIDKDEIILGGGEEAEVKLKVKVPEGTSPDEWTSLDFVVMPEKGKSEKINLLVTLREPREMLKTEITHEPEEFKEGERVVTKVRIENVGEKEAENKKVILKVNGKEKNRIEGVTIPPNAVVEIELPWIAEEENEVEVRVE